MHCKIANDFFLPDGKNTQPSQIVNTWTFDRLTLSGNKGVGVQLDYLGMQHMRPSTMWEIR